MIYDLVGRFSADSLHGLILSCVQTGISVAHTRKASPMTDCTPSSSRLCPIRTLRAS